MAGNYKMNYLHDPWAKLAQAVLASGIKEGDKRFLQSNWHDILQEMVSLDLEIYDKTDHGNIKRGGYNYAYCR